MIFFEFIGMLFFFGGNEFLVNFWDYWVCVDVIKKVLEMEDEEKEM